jgi:hypothetical protein
MKFLKIEWISPTRSVLSADSHVLVLNVPREETSSRDKGRLVQGKGEHFLDSRFFNLFLCQSY